MDRTTEANSYHIHPFLHSFSNHLSTENLLRRISIPDICPSEVLSPGSGEFSLVAGDFEDIYGSTEEKGRWSGVVTCFFIDCVGQVTCSMFQTGHHRREWNQLISAIRLETC